MTDKIKKYCEGLDCSICGEKEPCIYKVANKLGQALTEIKECLTKNAEKGWVSTSEIDDILQKCEVLDKT